MTVVVVANGPAGAGGGGPAGGRVPECVAVDGLARVVVPSSSELVKWIESSESSSSMARPDLVLAFAIVVATDPFAFGLPAGVLDRPRPRSDMPSLVTARHKGDGQLEIPWRGSCSGTLAGSQMMQSNAWNAIAAIALHALE